MSGESGEREREGERGRESERDRGNFGIYTQTSSRAESILLAGGKPEPRKTALFEAAR